MRTRKKIKETIRRSRTRSSWYVPDPGDLFKIHGVKGMRNRFIKTGDSYELIPHILYIWVRKIRPAPMSTVRLHAHERQRTLGVIWVWKPEVFPQGAIVEPAKWISALTLKKYLDRGFDRLRPHKNSSLGEKNMARFYRKIGVICEKPKQIGI